PHTQRVSNDGPTEELSAQPPYVGNASATGLPNWCRYEGGSHDLRLIAAPRAEGQMQMTLSIRKSLVGLLVASLAGCTGVVGGSGTGGAGTTGTGTPGTAGTTGTTGGAGTTGTTGGAGTTGTGT